MPLHPCQSRKSLEPCSSRMAGRYCSSKAALSRCGQLTASTAIDSQSSFGIPFCRRTVRVSLKSLQQAEDLISCQVLLPAKGCHSLKETCQVRWPTHALDLPEVAQQLALLLHVVMQHQVDIAPFAEAATADAHKISNTERACVSCLKPKAVEALHTVWSPCSEHTQVQPAQGHAAQLDLMTDFQPLLTSARAK